MQSNLEVRIPNSHIVGTNLAGSFIAESNANEREVRKVLSELGGNTQILLENGLDWVGAVKSYLLNMKYYRGKDRSLVSFDFGTDSDRYPKIKAILERTGNNNHELGPIINEYYLVYGDFNIDSLERVTAGLFIRNDFLGEPIEVEINGEDTEELKIAFGLSGELDNFLNIQQ